MKRRDFLATAAATPHALGQQGEVSLTAAYRERAARILAAAQEGTTAYARLAYLCDRIGHRLSGSPQLDAAIRWVEAEMRRDGFDAVRAEKVMVPRWVRGGESAELLEPAARPLVMLGLGGSVGTPRGGVTGDVVVVRTFEELEALPADAVRGKIVCFDAPFTTYGQTVRFRSQGPSAAARRGAVAALVRSVGPVSLRTPHTGSLRYADDAPKIPAAAVTIEDAEMLARMQARGERVRVRLSMEAKTLPDAESANVVADLRGSEKPEEIVLVSGHLDSWDVGQGAHDDGGGCLAAWEAARLLKSLDLRPRRTVRVVLYTNEENGLGGGTGYRDAHAGEIDRHVLAVESDSGVFDPKGFGVSGGGDRALALAKEVGTLLAPIGADAISAGGGGADIGPLMERGVVGMGLQVEGSRYFHLHHTPADTLDKVDPASLNKCVAAMAVMAYVVADMPGRLDGK
ncbi:MAG TPA: M20/M25/M40 family metallo-hydrolase [Armatimonadaceae bacterium]|nr:M20/M25/M40 family metallo-hydrolase [Armatimonadaceae bacterium]